MTEIEMYWLVLVGIKPIGLVRGRTEEEATKEAIRLYGDQIDGRPFMVIEY